MVDSSDKELTSHAISLFVIRKDGGFQIFNQNSEASSFTRMPDLFKRLKCPVQYFVSTVGRQSSHQHTCQSFAMDDCAKFSIELAAQILDLNGLSSVSKEGCYAIRQLPESMMELTRDEKAEEFLQNCIEYLQNAPLPSRRKPLKVSLLEDDEPRSTACQQVAKVAAAVAIALMAVFFARTTVV